MIAGMKRVRLESRCGITLMEALVAISLSVVVLGVLFSLYGTISGSVRATESLNTRFQETMVVMDQLSQDLRAAVDSGDEEHPAFVLAPAESEIDDVLLTLALTVVEASAKEDSVGLGGSSEARVVYRLSRPEGDFLSKSISLSRQINDKEAVVVLTNVEAFLVEVFDGEGWFPAWPVSVDDAAALPLTVRLSLRGAGKEGSDRARTIATEVLIPAAMVVTRASRRD
jgi:type II secretory pathway component PulJ